MMAVRLHRHGGLEQLRFVEVPVPQHRHNEVLVRIKAAALNHRDIWVREGRSDVKIIFPLTPGLDIAGVVEAVGETVDPAWIGRDVLLHPSVTCGLCRACVSGKDDECIHYDSLGNSTNGGYAEYVTVPSTNLIPMPSTLSYVEAASLPLVLLTAWNAMVTVGRIRPGEDVLVQAVGSGVGVMLIQIAKIFGARTIGTAGSDLKLQRARDLGLDEGINYKSTDFLSEVQRLTDDKGVELVCEQVGGDVFVRSLASLARRGRLVTYGATTGSDVSIDILALHEQRATAHFVKLGRKQDLLDAMDFVQTGQIRPVIDRVFSLQEAALAQQYMLERSNFGKIVLQVERGETG
jgi:NADPH:quinone reductase-like Zn-dependent oxidoreductase